LGGSGNDPPTVGRRGAFAAGGRHFDRRDLKLKEGYVTPKQLTLLALERMKGDDAERARWNFRGFSADQMELPHGRSGKSRRQVLQEYEQVERDIQEAINWVNQQVSFSGIFSDPN